MVSYMSLVTWMEISSNPVCSIEGRAENLSMFIVRVLQCLFDLHIILLGAEIRNFCTRDNLFLPANKPRNAWNSSRYLNLSRLQSSRLIIGSIDSSIMANVLGRLASR